MHKTDQSASPIATTVNLAEAMKGGAMFAGTTGDPLRDQVKDRGVIQDDGSVKMQGTRAIPELMTIDTDLRAINVSQSYDEDAKVKSYVATIDGVDIPVSDRFMTSFCGRVGQGRSVLNLFDFDEVVDRFVKKNTILPDESGKKGGSKPQTSSQLTLEVDSAGTPISALSLVKHDAFVVGFDFLKDALGDRATGFDYRDGFFRAYAKSVTELELSFHGENFGMFSMFEVPVDGFGSPTNYIMALRALCQNKLVSYNSLVSSKCNAGNAKSSPDVAVRRFFEQPVFADDHLNDIRGRIDTAFVTPASASETVGLVEAIVKDEIRRLGGETQFSEAAANNLVFPAGLLRSHAFPGLDGAIVNLNDNDLRRIPSRNVTVKNLLDMASEYNTHHNPNAVDTMIWAGKRLGGERKGKRRDLSFDFEGDTTTIKTPENRRFWVPSSAKIARSNGLDLPGLAN